jgi:hypothetical protein
LLSCLRKKAHSLINTFASTTCRSRVGAHFVPNFENKVRHHQRLFTPRRGGTQTLPKQGGPHPRRGFVLPLRNATNFVNKFCVFPKLSPGRQAANKVEYVASIPSAWCYTERMCKGFGWFGQPSPEASCTCYCAQRARSSRACTRPLGGKAHTPQVLLDVRGGAGSTSIDLHGPPSSGHQICGLPAPPMPQSML